ncbi:tail fiber domain-containing protein [Winogradskyella sp.]|uniref:tail fiber domain-containing protein n=1 Tax=Winogradskyella sp. TaxID=1883156 RepID=UPI0025F9F0A0|nr:tail fiber domain-containing protein [Winogradskyella sp.]
MNVKNLRFSLVLFLFFYAINAQVGVGNTDPQASLDITASSATSPANNDGILIPRMSVFPTAPGATRDGILIFYTGSAADGKGFYYWDDTASNWIKIVSGSLNDNDWTVSGNNIYRDLITARTLIGTNTPGNYNLTITNNSNTIDIGNINSGVDAMVINKDHNTGNGLVVNQNGTNSTGNKSAIVGTNDLNNFRADIAFSEHSLLQTAGVYVTNSNITYSEASGFLYRIDQPTSRVGNFYGSWMDMNINVNVGALYGYKSDIEGAGNASRYGFYTSVPTSSGGTHYGLYSEVLKTGSYAGYFSGAVSIGTTNVNHYSLPSFRGNNGDIMQIDNLGQVNFVNASTVFANTDNQNISGSGLSGTNLTIGIQNGSNEIVDVSTLDQSTEVTTNAANILINTSDINNNTSDIITNANNIILNTTGINNNTSDISFNTLNIGNNTTIITNNTNNISNNTIDINNNNVDIGNNSTAISTNTINLNTHIASDADTVIGNEIITSGILTGTNLEIEEAGNTTTIDLSGLQDGTGTDDQDIENLIFNTSTNILTVGIENGTAQTVNLSSLDNPGNINQITAGTGLTGGGATGNVTINAVGTNGLTTNANDIRLGGALIENTTISQGTRSFAINLNSTGDFAIQDDSDNVFFVEDSGDIGIGTSNPAHPLHLVENTGDELEVIYVDKNDNTADETNGIYVVKSSGGTGRSHAIRTRNDGTGAGQKYGVFNTISSTASGSQYGTRNFIAGASPSFQFGTFNNLDNAGTGNHYGTYNGMRGTSAANLYGVFNEFQEASTAAETTGIRNSFTTGTPGTSGMNGTYTTFSNTANGDYYGSRNVFNNSATGTGNKYGTYNLISSSAGGTHYGIYSSATKSNSYAGYFLGRVSVGTTTTNNYILPASRGTNGQVMATNAAGVLSWQTPTVGDVTAITAGAGLTGGGTSGNLTVTATANNGLNVDAGADRIQWGGALTEDTAITYGNFDTRFNLSNTGDFIIQDNGTGVFEINDAGTTTLGRDMVWRDVNTTGTIIAQMLDDGDDARFILRENGNVSVDLDTNSQFVFNEQGANRDFRVESDSNANMLRIDASANRAGIAGFPDIDFHVFHGNSGTTSGMKLQNTNNNNWIRMYVSSGTGDLRFYSTNQGTTSISNINDVSGVYTATSDRRLKKDFKDLYFSWDNFMELQPLTYKYKADNGLKSYIGMVAQDVDKIYPELISYHKEEDVYHMDYSATGVVAIKATQELKKEVKELNLKMETLEAENKILKQRLSKLQQLEVRLLALENKSNSTTSETASTTED